MIKATLIIPTYNMGHQIERTISSLLSQSESNFELIVIDDASTDGTKEKIKAIHDKRLRYIRNRKNIGKSLSRNKAIKLSKSNNLFFTDAGCIATKGWLKNGLKYLSQNDCVGVEGKIYYVSKTYTPTLSDRVTQNLSGGEYMTANAGYKKNTLIEVGLFDKRYIRNQDRELALRVKRLGNILFTPSMIVYHEVSKWTPSSYIKSASWVYFRTVLLFKYFNERYNMFFLIYAPEKLLAIIFPPIILIKLFTQKYKSREDYVHFLLLYPQLVYERFVLWRSCLRENIFII